MLHRVTITLDEEIIKKARHKQAKSLRKSKKHVSFSSIVNQCLKECLKGEKISF